MLRFLSSTLCLACIALQVGCAGDSATEDGPIEEVRLYLPYETSAALAPEVARFNALRVKTPGGSTVAVSPIESDGPSQSLAFLAAAGNHQAAMWLAPSALAVEVLGAPAGALLGVSLECSLLAQSELGFAVREADLFAVDQHEGSGLLTQLLGSPAAVDPAKRPIIVLPAPDSSASGLPVFAMLVSAALGVRPEALSLEPLRVPDDLMRSTQSRVARYFSSEREMLRWLRQRPEGQPAVALTSRQQVAVANAAPVGAPLAFVRATVPQMSLDYSLCSVKSSDISPAAQDARRLALRHFLGTKAASALREAGFSTPETVPPINHLPPAGVASALPELWLKVRKPASVAFVVDTSSGVPKDFLAAAARELSSFALRSGTLGDALTLISTSTRPELLAQTTSDPRLFQAGLGSLRPSGVSVTLDGLSLAFGSLEGAPESKYRLGIVLIASQRDAGSSVSRAALRGRFSQTLARSGTAVLIIGVDLGTSSAGLDWLRGLAHDIGAEYVETPLSELPRTLRGTLQAVE